MFIPPIPAHVPQNLTESRRVRADAHGGCFFFPQPLFPMSAGSFGSRSNGERSTTMQKAYLDTQLEDPLSISRNALPSPYGPSIPVPIAATLMYVLCRIILLCDIVKGIITTVVKDGQRHSLQKVTKIHFTRCPRYPCQKHCIAVGANPARGSPRLTPGAKVRYKGGGEVVICCFTTVMPSLSVFR
jgi:hypothetical protein